MNKRFIIKIVVLIFSAKTIFCNIDSDSKFIKKFINDYGFKARDRYTHEYNSALLEKTAYSLDELEENLEKNNINLSGRLIICGYEEQAFPSYYFRYKKAEINDEASSKNNVGWSLRLHNIFGFLTGFLFKDFNFYANRWFMGENPVIEHIDSDEIEIFKNESDIFNEDSFGQTLPIMQETQYKIIKNFKEKNYNKIFEELIKFWNFIYKKETKVGNNKPASTQDILFSIEYAKHLIRSPLSFLKWYVGPDITYPIEVSSAQGEEATIHAQNFVKTFAQNLKPIQKKPTVFIFCSFVDGVGKSTLLGNIKNYFKYGTNINEYERVDNSSSQFAEIFKLKNNVFIADLPAQVSHFTYKPDGYVYVNIEREYDQKLIKKLQLFAIQNKKNLIKKYKNNLEKVEDIINTQGFLTSIFNDKKNPDYAFIKNLILTKKANSNNWIPFKIEEKNYIFNKSNPSKIRVFVPLKIVQSEGLKNIETEQMLFLKGIKLPLPYNYFIQDLINKLKTNEIENVVFVDFISMYPRSSRENVRINYLIQQLSLLDRSFDINSSLYRNFINDSELLYILSEKKSYEKIVKGFKLEVLTRLALFNLINKHKSTTLKGIPLEKITENIKDEISKINNKDLFLAQEFVNIKTKEEIKKLKKIFGKTKNYINIQKLSFKNLIYFSELLSDLFSNHVKNENLNQLWQSPEIINNKSKQEIYSGKLDRKIKTINDQELYCYYVFNPEFREEHTLTPFLRMLRSFWYASITNLFFSKPTSPETLFIKDEIYNISPLFLKLGLDNRIYLVQNTYNEWEENLPKKSKVMKNIFHLKTNEKEDWVKFDNKAYRSNWNSTSTDYGLYAFDCNLANIKNTRKTACTFLVQKYQEEKAPDHIITASKLYKKIKKSYVWKREYSKILKKAKKNSKQKNKSKNKKNKKSKIKIGTQEQKPALRLITRLLVTLEMILKDPNSDIAIRYLNRKDFKAGIKLFEKMTLPKSFGILFEEDLFDDYDQVEPYPSWEAWENLN
ncbi:hypothetical protein GF385_04040 [Candidatus Dependentiae bacterium]|nr:hypothetical protein [Candidatus Dependentiae bacterium]